MLHSCLLTALLLIRLSLASDSNTESEEENRPWVFNFASDVTSVIRQFLEPEQYYQLVFALRDPESPFTWQTVGYGQTTAAIRRNLACPEGGSDVIFDSQDWFVLEHPVRPEFYPTQCPYTGRASFCPVNHYLRDNLRVFCPTTDLDGWHFSEDFGDRIFQNEGDPCFKHLAWDHCWLLDNYLVIGYHNDRLLGWMPAAKSIEEDCDFYLETSAEIQLDHDLNIDNVGFRGEDHMQIVEIEESDDTVLITNTDGHTGVSSQIKAKLPESFRMHSHYFHVKGQWLLVTGQIRFGWKLLVIDTEDGSVKQRVPLMGLPDSVEISPQAEYALVSFQFDTLPIHLIHLDSPFNRLTIIPGSFGYESLEWLTHELFKMAITYQGTRYYCVRSAAHPSRNICEAIPSMRFGYSFSGIIDNGARMLCDDSVYYAPGVIYGMARPDYVVMRWEGDPEGKPMFFRGQFHPDQSKP